MNNIWQLQDAKSKFSEMIEQTLANGAQIVTRRGQKTVVVVSFDEYQRLTRQTDRLSDFLLASPLPGSDLTIERDKSTPRGFEIEP